MERTGAATYLSAYLTTYVPTCLLIYLTTYLRTYLKLSIHLPTTCPLIYPPTCPPACPASCLQACDAAAAVQSYQTKHISPRAVVALKREYESNNWTGFSAEETNTNVTGLVVRLMMKVSS